MLFSAIVPHLSSCELTSDFKLSDELHPSFWLQFPWYPRTATVKKVWRHKTTLQEVALISQHTSRSLNLQLRSAAKIPVKTCPPHGKVYPQRLASLDDNIVVAIM